MHSQMQITYSIVAIVIAALINLGIFAMKGDVAELKAESFQAFIQKDDLSDLNTRIDSLDKKVDNITNILINKK